MWETVLAGFEDLIRGALEKQANPTPQMRQKVYESARQALNRMVDNNATMTPEVIEGQRKKLEAAISSIESDYASSDKPAPSEPAKPTQPPAATSGEAESKQGYDAGPSAPSRPEPPKPEPPKPEAPKQASPNPKTVTSETPKPEASKATATAPQQAPAPSPPTSSATSASPPRPETSKAPDVQQAASAPKVSPSAVPPAAPSAPPAPKPTTARAETGSEAASQPVRLEEQYDDLPEGYLGNTRRERKPFARLLLWTIILVGLGVAIWWSINHGPALLRAQLEGNVPNSNLTLSSGPVSSGSEDEEGWLTVFAPQDDAQNVVTKGAGAAELQQDGNRPVMRLASPDASLDNNLLIRLPRGTMQDLRGKSATFELVIRSGGDEGQSFVIFCEFGALGDCGRKRFNAGSNPKPVLFDVLINDAELAEGEDAFISINTDFEGNGRPLDLYSIRIRQSP